MNNKGDELLKVIEKTPALKVLVERFKQYGQELHNFLSSGYRVVTGPTPEEMLQQLFQIIKHAEGLWYDARLLFERRRYATACFLSIVCIEECAKINFGSYQYTLFFQYPPQSLPISRRRNPLSFHVKKHFLAACSGALINSRMDRVLGREKIDSFISDCEKGKLEKLRQNCLYADVNQSGRRVLLPSEQINREQALFYTCLAGELLVEVEGIDRSIQGGLRDELSKFEKENGLNA